MLCSVVLSIQRPNLGPVEVAMPFVDHSGEMRVVEAQAAARKDQQLRVAKRIGVVIFFLLAIVIALAHR
jgi:hypothetical protein